MNKTEFIEKYGEAAYDKQLLQNRNWKAKHPEEVKAHLKDWNAKHSQGKKALNKEWRESNPKKIAENNHEESQKGGKYYEHNRHHKMTGIPHEKVLVRQKHQRIWTPFKQIIAPASQIHHEWIPGTADYTGVALVEKDQHLHGFIDVIQILEGEITLFAEAEVRRSVG